MDSEKVASFEGSTVGSEEVASFEGSFEHYFAALADIAEKNLDYS